jgi:glycine dehydrogenase subunit 2
VGVSKTLVDLLPHPAIGEESGRYFFAGENPQNIGKVSTFYGNFAIIVRAYCYIRMLGARGLRQVSEGAILNANYLLSLIREFFDLPYKTRAMHEFVLSGNRQKAKGIKTLDMAKRLLDFGFHAPTVYFPLIVPEALMIEPTETESRETLEAFARAMIQIAKEAEENPEILKDAPATTPVSRLDEAKAARELDVKYDMSSCC